LLNGAIYQIKGSFSCTKQRFFEVSGSATVYLVRHLAWQKGLEVSLRREWTNQNSYSFPLGNGSGHYFAVANYERDFSAMDAILTICTCLNISQTLALFL